MKSLFENKEARLREELGEERDKLAREGAVLRQRLEQAEAGRATAEVCMHFALVGFGVVVSRTCSTPMCAGLCEEMARSSASLVGLCVCAGAPHCECFRAF